MTKRCKAELQRLGLTQSHWRDDVRVKNIHRGIAAAGEYLKLAKRNSNFRLNGTSAYAEGFNRVMHRYQTSRFPN